MNTFKAPQRVVFFARNESSVRMDILAFRRLDTTSIRLETNAENLLASLAPATADGAEAGPFQEVLVCDGKITDPSIFGLLRSMAEHPQLKHWPVLVLVSEKTTGTLLKNAHVPVLERPYSLLQLEQSLMQVQSAARMPLQADLLTLNKPAPHRQEKIHHHIPTTSELFETGAAAMRKGDMTTAKRLFQATLVRQPQHTKAHLAVAKACRQLREYDTMYQHLVHAMTSALRQGNKELAESIIPLMPERLREGNIFVHEAMLYMEKKNFIEAARSFTDAPTLTGKVSLQNLIARACQFTPQPAGHIEELCMAFERAGHETTAQYLRTHLLQGAEIEEPKNRPGWLDNFPLLRDTLDVMSMTAGMWKQV